MRKRLRLLLCAASASILASCGAARMAPDDSVDREQLQVGYGTASRGDNAMTVSEVKMSEVEETAFNDIFSYLRSKVPGVEVGYPSGAGDRPHIQIRGTRSILGNEGEPIFVVDGVEFPQIENIRPDEIYSVQVLKDSAASSYGSRGANGVISITTKVAYEAEERELAARKAERAARRRKKEESKTEKNMRNILVFGWLSSLLLAGCSVSVEPEPQVQPRTVVLTDGEVDDYDSFIRVLLYANEMDLAAIVLTASQWHWEGDGQGTLLLPENRWEGPREGMSGTRFEAPKESHRWIGREWVPDLIDAYAQCYENLKKHDPDYPSPEYLHSIIKIGNVRVEGDMAADTEGSDYVKQLLLDDDLRPLYLQVWGGTNTVARALLSIEEQYKDTSEWESVYRKVSDKARLYLIQDQDGTYLNYVQKNWPEIRTVYNGTQFFGFAYLWERATPREMHPVLKGDWFRTNIVNGHGPLTAKYLGLGIPYPFEDPEDHYGDPEMVQRRPGADFNDFISEGDSPSYFQLFNEFMGLRSLEHPEWGGLGGRFNEKRSRFWKDPMPEGGFSPFPRRPRPDEPQQEKPKVTFDRSAGDFNPYTGEVDLFYPQMRWTEVLQNDFAARADWCVKDYADANHAPVASVKGDVDLTVKPGRKMTLRGSATDPDGDSVSLCWWQYREAGTSDAELVLEGADGANVSFAIPADAKSGETFHLILEAKDSGAPALRHFQRVIVTVK